MNVKDVRMGYAALAVSAVSVLVLILLCAFTDHGFHDVSFILTAPFVVTGFISHILGRRKVALTITLAVALIIYLLWPGATPIALMVLPGIRGLLEITAIAQRLLFREVVSSVETINTGRAQSLGDRTVRFLFGIPSDLDARYLAMDTSLCRRHVPYGDLAQTLIISLVPCMFLWTAMVLDPVFRTDAHLSVHIMTFVMYIVAISLPWTIFASPNVRIRRFTLSEGLSGTMWRMLLPLSIILIVLAVVLSADLQVIGNILLSLVMTAVMVTIVSSVYYIRDEVPVVRSVVGEWTASHPTGLDSGYGDVVGTRDDVPGTPVRDPGSCFVDEKDQKY